ncbi:hypothetical protein HX069_11900 [Myroides odoratimimus]|uniref:hypothetical protein n=1 Tax=Myroides odoratimimus TaxID=76832 RepID=UPI00257736D3|nr:hypothetical protein [Myroides odoratimimus]MDM1679853.1 hypothetical protein [Myroides odoratimimus]
MIKFNREEGSCPNVLTERGISEVESLVLSFENDIESFKSKTSKELFKSDIYGCSDVKDKLKEIQHNKCCFCESYITHISYGDVEHFRPKAGWVQENEGINKPGYFFLAYDWNNLMLSCTICNQRNKRNFFPLENPEFRTNITEAYNINNEQPLFIDPFIDNPEEHIEFVEELPRAKNSSLKGEKTIEFLDLQRNELNEIRNDYISLLNSLKETMLNNTFSSEIREYAKSQLKKELNEKFSKNRPYLAMLKCNFKEFLNE